MREIISGRMSDRVLLCMCRLSITLRSKKSSWRAVVVMRWPEVIYQEVNKSRLTHFNKNTGGGRKSGHLQSILRHLFFLCLCLYFF